MPPMHNDEYLAFERLRDRKQEVQQQRAQFYQVHPGRLRHFVGYFGAYFVAFGVKLQQVGQRKERAIRYWRLAEKRVK